jgi:hypothetical protein
MKDIFPHPTAPLNEEHVQGRELGWEVISIHLNNSFPSLRRANRFAVSDEAISFFVAGSEIASVALFTRNDG